MTALPIILTRTAKHAYRWLRETAYDDMARQAAGWVPDDARIEPESYQKPPIKLDFAVPRKHRLGWIRRTLQHLPH